MRKAILLLALAVGGSGCLKPDHIDMEPKELSFSRRGDETWVHAIFRDERGKQYPKEHAVWSSSDEKVAKVDNHDKPGNVVATGPGHATITVKSDEGLVAELPVNVVTVEKIKVSPDTVKLTTDGERVVLAVQAFDGSGHVLRDRKAHMACANEKVCNSDGDGVWPSGEAGQTTVEVDVDDQKVVVPVVVEEGKSGKKK